MFVCFCHRYHGDRRLLSDGGGGGASGVRVSTRRVVRDGSAVSTLTIPRPDPEHSGLYSCRPANLDPAFARLHVIRGEKRGWGWGWGGKGLRMRKMRIQFTQSPRLTFLETLILSFFKYAKQVKGKCARRVAIFASFRVNSQSGRTANFSLHGGKKRSTLIIHFYILLHAKIFTF